MYGLQEALKGTKDENRARDDRVEATKAIGEAAAAVSEAAGLVYHPKATRELKRGSGALLALQLRVAGSTSLPMDQAVRMGEEYAALREFAGMLLGQGLSEGKQRGLLLARAAKKAKDERNKEAARLAKNRGAIRPLGF
jgi:hypothetical protein